jgi:hypothetical protein
VTPAEPPQAQAPAPAAAAAAEMAAADVKAGGAAQAVLTEVRKLLSLVPGEVSSHVNLVKLEQVVLGAELQKFGVSSAIQAIIENAGSIFIGDDYFKHAALFVLGITSNLFSQHAALGAPAAHRAPARA